MSTATATTARRASASDSNQLRDEDRPAHQWYRFVLSYPPHLVRTYLRRFNLEPGAQVLDPFCGTGTTAVECKKQGIASVGLEANGMAHFASQVKLDWAPDPAALVHHAEMVAEAASAALEADGVADNAAYPLSLGLLGTEEHLRRLSQEQESLLLANSISPRPLHKVLVLLEQLGRMRDDQFFRHELLALATTVVNTSSNLHFGPEVGVGPLKADAAVVGPWLERIRAMAQDVSLLRNAAGAPATVHHTDARDAALMLQPNSIDAVITSPPYPNEKDYTRTTRLESVLLGFLSNKEELRALKKGLMRSNTRGVYKGDDDDAWVRHHAEIERIAQAIEERRIALGKTSGFERLYGRVTKLYFGGMARHFAELRQVLKPGAQLAYVVGDQASYLRVMIRTGQLLADIAQSLGYEVVDIDLFRTRQATATRELLREEVVVLRWPGGS